MGEWTVEELMNLVEGYSALMKAAERGDATEKQCDEIWEAIRRTATGLKKGNEMASEMAMQYASRAWCQPETSNKEMDVELGAAFAKVLDDWAEISNTTHLHKELEIVRKQRDAWWDTAYERMLLLQEAREFVIAYMKQCDVPCGMEGAEVLLGKINQTVADLRSNIR